MTLLTDEISVFGQLLGETPPCFPGAPLEWRPQSVPRLTLINSLDPPEHFCWGDVIIEAFGTPIPESWKRCMGERKNRPLWINLEYLSAEQWVADFHGLRSTDPASGWQQHFFYPGFTESTGGLLGPEAPPSEVQQDFSRCRIFVFAYSLTPLIKLLQRSALSEQTEVYIAAASNEILPLHEATSGSVRPVSVDFVPQRDFDHLLSHYDWLFVRGEDSFVRAQWAGKPMIWQIYPTDDQAHWTKLRAFFDLYTETLPPETKAAWWRLWRFWNGAQETSPAESAPAIWNSAWQHREALAKHAAQWRDRLVTQTSLIERLNELICQQTGRESPGENSDAAP